MYVVFYFPGPSELELKNEIKWRQQRRKKKKEMKTKQNNHREFRLVYFPWPHDVTRKSRFSNPSLRSFPLSCLFSPSVLLYVYNILVQLIEEYSERKAWWPFNKLSRVITRPVFIFFSFFFFQLVWCSILFTVL